MAPDHRRVHRPDPGRPRALRAPQPRRPSESRRLHCPRLPPSEPLDAATARLLHRTIAVVREDFAALRFHTAIARIIELTAHASRLPRVPRALAEPLVLMVAPLAPHIAEELWQRLGHPSSLAREPFPQADPALAATATVTLPVQVNGKVRFTIEVPASGRSRRHRRPAGRPPRLPPRQGSPPGHRPRQDRQHRPPVTRAAIPSASLHRGHQRSPQPQRPASTCHFHN